MHKSYSKPCLNILSNINFIIKMVGKLLTNTNLKFIGNSNGYQPIDYYSVESIFYLLCIKYAKGSGILYSQLK